MTAKTPSLDELRAQARLTFRYWPIYLMLRLREIEQHLAPEQRSPLLPSRTMIERQRLVTAGLWPDDVPMPAISSPPLLALPDDADLYFEVEGDALIAVAENPSASWQVPILRTSPEHGDTLRNVAALFDTIRREQSPQNALDIARDWAALHGARGLDWAQTIKHPPPPKSNGNHRRLPPRKRGKGQFRDPY